MVILEDFEVMSASTHRWALVNDNARGYANHDLLERVPLLLPRIIAFALLGSFGLALRLLDPINDECQFGISLAKLFDTANVLFPSLLFFVS